MGDGYVFGKSTFWDEAREKRGFDTMGIESTNVSGIKKMIKTELRIRNTKKLASPGGSWRTKERETWKG